VTIQTDSRITSEMLTDGLNNTFPYDFPIFKGDNGQKGVEVRFMNELGYDIVDPSLFLIIEDSDNTSGMVQFYVPPVAGKRLLIAGKTPQQAQQAIQDSALTAQQKEGMLRSLTNYQFSPNMTTFPMEGTPEYTKLMADLSQGKEQTYSAPTLEVKAKGVRTNRQPQGALSQMSRLTLGAGDGRSDSIDAKLSDGEYVIDAETVALLGNGSTKAGAAMLDQMRQGLRKQKGKALAKGKFSPNAKAPLAYMKGGLQ